MFPKQQIRRSAEIRKVGGIVIERLLEGVLPDIESKDEIGAGEDNIDFEASRRETAAGKPAAEKRDAGTWRDPTMRLSKLEGSVRSNSSACRHT